MTEPTPTTDAVFSTAPATNEVAVVDETVQATVDVTAPDPAYADEVVDGLTEEQVRFNAYLAAEQAWKTRLDPEWEHERFEYKGDYLAVRKPQMQALAGFQLASTRFLDDDRRADITGLFVDQHVGRDSYDHMMRRLMDPDDPDYSTKSISEIMGGLVAMAVEDIKAEAKAEAERIKAQKGLRAVR